MYGNSPASHKADFPHHPKVFQTKLNPFSKESDVSDFLRSSQTANESLVACMPLRMLRMPKEHIGQNLKYIILKGALGANEHCT